MPETGRQLAKSKPKKQKPMAKNKKAVPTERILTKSKGTRKDDVGRTATGTPPDGSICSTNNGHNKTIMHQNIRLCGRSNENHMGKLTKSLAISHATTILSTSDECSLSQSRVVASAGGRTV